MAHVPMPRNLSLIHIYGRSFCIRVTPYSRSGSHINEVLWIFADEEVE